MFYESCLLLIVQHCLGRPPRVGRGAGQDAVVLRANWGYTYTYIHTYITISYLHTQYTYTYTNGASSQPRQQPRRLPRLRFVHYCQNLLLLAYCYCPILLLLLVQYCSSSRGGFRACASSLLLLMLLLALLPLLLIFVLEARLAIAQYSIVV